METPYELPLAPRPAPLIRTWACKGTDEGQLCGERPTACPPTHNPLARAVREMEMLSSQRDASHYRPAPDKTRRWGRNPRICSLNTTLTPPQQCLPGISAASASEYEKCTKRPSLLTSIGAVMPWHFLPNPDPSLQPMAWSILLPMLLLSRPSLVGCS